MRCIRRRRGGANRVTVCEAQLPASGSRLVVLGFGLSEVVLLAAGI